MRNTPAPRPSDIVSSSFAGLRVFPLPPPTLTLRPRTSARHQRLRHTSQPHNTCVTSSLACLCALAASRAFFRSARPAESRKSFDTSHAASFKARIHSSRSANEGVACTHGEGRERSRLKVGPRRTVAAGCAILPASMGGAGRGKQRGHVHMVCTCTPARWCPAAGRS